MGNFRDGMGWGGRQESEEEDSLMNVTENVC